MPLPGYTDEQTTRIAAAALKFHDVVAKGEPDPRYHNNYSALQELIAALPPRVWNSYLDFDLAVRQAQDAEYGALVE